MKCSPDDLLYATSVGCLYDPIMVTGSLLFALQFAFLAYVSARAGLDELKSKRRKRKKPFPFLFSFVVCVLMANTTVLTILPFAAPQIKFFFFKLAIVSVVAMLLNSLDVVTKLLVKAVMQRENAPGNVQSILKLSWLHPTTAALLFVVYASGIGVTMAGAVLGVVDSTYEDLGVTVFSIGIATFVFFWALIFHTQISKIERYVSQTSKIVLKLKVRGPQVSPPSSVVAVASDASENGSSSTRSSPNKGSSPNSSQKSGFEPFLARLRLVRYAMIGVTVASVALYSLHAALVIPMTWYLALFHYANVMTTVGVYLIFFMNIDLVATAKTLATCGSNVERTAAESSSKEDAGAGTTTAA